ncbi:MAG: hypothetical protein M1371_03755 [Actinobacteria bacterium]|nr:hypothetical protein [Actinomycetota bacterium]
MQREKAKVGFISVTCPTHIEAKTETGIDWVNKETVDNANNAIENMDFDVVRFNKIVDSVEDSFEAADLMIKEDVDCVIIFIATWNWAAQIMQAVRKIGKPVILWAIPIPPAWNIGGLAVTHGSFDEVGYKHLTVYGSVDEEDVLERIKSYIKACYVKNILSKSTYGSIGGQGMGIHTGIIDANQWMEEFGILVSFTDQYAVVVEAEKIERDKVTAYHNLLKSAYGQVPPLNDVTERSIRLYLSLEEIIKREKYDFTGVKCTFDLSDNYCSACLAQSRLSSRGYVTACLNDSNGALTMYMLRLLTKEPLFMADVNFIQKKEKIIRLIDDGSASINLAKNPKDVKLDFQPTLEAKASGVCTGLICKPGRVTLARFQRVMGYYQMHIVTGEAIEADPKLVYECGYPMWPHAFIKLDGDIEKFIQNLRSEYIHMVYGNLKDELLAICDVLNIEPTVS